MKRIAISLILALLVGMLAACAEKTPAPTEPSVVWTPNGSAPSEDAALSTKNSQAPDASQSDGTHYVSDGCEYAIFPMDYLQITQTSHEGTHLCNWAVDLAGSSRGIDQFYAPFTCRIVRIQEGYNIVWAESVNPVHLANGDLSIVNMMLEHDDNIDNLHVGQLIQQGEVFYDEGTAGNADGNHVHVEFGYGPFVDQGCYHAEDGKVAVNEGMPINDVLFLTESTQIVEEETGGFEWKKLPATTEDLLANGYACQGEGHLCREATSVSEPTCDCSGAMTFVCGLCGEPVTTTIEPTGHTLEESDRKEPNGDAPGSVRYSCSVCGASWRELLWAEVSDFPFTDVDDRDAPYVAAICERGVMSGYSDSEFLPEGSFDRAELACILYDLGGSAGYDCDYRDVVTRDDYYDAVAWATAKELAGNTEGDRFSPEAPVTRADALGMVCGYLKLKGIDVTGGDIGDYTDWAVDIGMISPSDNVRCALTRAECARLLENMFLLLED